MSNFSQNGTSGERLTAVERVRSGWVRRLIDLSRRNNLLYYRNLKTGTLDLSNSDNKELTELLAGKTVVLTHLLPQAEELKIPFRTNLHQRLLILNQRVPSPTSFAFWGHSKPLIVWRVLAHRQSGFSERAGLLLPQY